MIDLVTGWFEIAQYEDKIAIFIATLTEITFLSRCYTSSWPCPPPNTELNSCLTSLIDNLKNNSVER